MKLQTLKQIEKIMILMKQHGVCIVEIDGVKLIMDGAQASLDTTPTMDSSDVPYEESSEYDARDTF